MSELLKDLVGRRCVIKTEEEEYLGGSADVLCRVTGMDGEWLRVTYTNDRGLLLARLCRVETLADITVFDT